MFGNDPKYVRGMFENVKLKDNLYKGWKIIVYYDSSVLRKTLEVLSADGNSKKHDRLRYISNLLEIFGRQRRRL